MQVGLLEDDVAIQEMLHLVLEDEGYSVTIYPTAEACLQALLPHEREQKALPIDLLIVDVRLARSISGIEVIRQLRKDPLLQSLPIILTTAAPLSDVEDLTDLHVTFLEKPFDLDEVGKMIKKLTANSSENLCIEL